MPAGDTVALSHNRITEPCPCCGSGSWCCGRIPCFATRICPPSSQSCTWAVIGWSPHGQQSPQTRLLMVLAHSRIIELRPCCGWGLVPCTHRALRSVGGGSPHAPSRARWVHTTRMMKSCATHGMQPRHGTCRKPRCETKVCQDSQSHEASELTPALLFEWLDGPRVIDRTSPVWQQGATLKCENKV